MENNNKKDEWVDLPVENNSTQKDEWVDVPISDEGEKKNSISQPFYKQKPILEDIGGVSEIVSQLKSTAQSPSEEKQGKYFIKDVAADATREISQTELDNFLSDPVFKDSIRQGKIDLNIEDDTDMGFRVAQALSPPPISEIAQPQTPEDLDFLESVKNTYENVGTRLHGVIPRLNVVAADVWENVLGKELAQKWYGLEGRDLEQVRQDAYTKLAELEKETKPTRGVVESVMKADPAGFAASVIDAVGALASTAVPSILTGGAGLFTEMVGESIVDYNKTKAETLDISVDELYKTNQAELGTPAFIGVVGGSMERMGLKGVIKGITKNITAKNLQKLAIIAKEANKEGMTEWVQTGLEEANKVLARGGSVSDASFDAGKKMVSEEGLESYLKGTLGSLVAIGGGRTAKGAISPFMVSKESRSKAKETEAKIGVLKQDLQNPEISSEIKTSLNETIKSAQDELLNLAEETRKEMQSLRKEIKDELIKVNEEISKKEEILADPNVSEQSKEIIKGEIEKLENTADEILTKQPPTPLAEVKEGEQKKQKENEILSNRLSQEEKQGVVAGGARNVEATNVAARIYETGSDGRANSEGLSQDQVREKQSEELESYAKENGIWVEDPFKTFGEKPHAKGAEAIVYLNPDGKTVTKINSGSVHGDWREFFERIAVHNSLFPEAAYTLKGFAKLSGDVSAVLEQPLIKADRAARYEEIKSDMALRGFKPTEYMSSDYFNPETGVFVRDLHGKNVLYKDGNLFYIDGIIELDTPDKGYGGTRKETTPPQPEAVKTEGAIKTTTDEGKKEGKEGEVLVPESKAEAKGVAKVAPEGEPTKKEYTAKETKQFAEENEAAKALGFETGANEALGSINRAIREGRFEGSKEKFDTYAEIPKQELERYAAERKVQKKKESERKKQIREADKKIRQEIKTAEPDTIRQLIMQMFLSGTKIKTLDFKNETGFGIKILGKTKGLTEFRQRIWMHKEDGIDIDRLAMNIAEEWESQYGKEVDTRDIRNEIISVTVDYGTPTSIMKDLLVDFSSPGGEIIKDRGGRAELKRDVPEITEIDLEKEKLLSLDVVEEILERGFTKDILEKIRENPDIISEEDYQALKNYFEYENEIRQEYESVVRGEEDAAIGEAPAKTTEETIAAGKPRTREEIESDLSKAESEYNTALSDYEKARKALSKDLSEKQASMFDGKEQKLFEDTRKINKVVEERKKILDAAKEKVDNLKKLLEGTLEGQKDIFEEGERKKVQEKIKNKTGEFISKIKDTPKQNPDNEAKLFLKIIPISNVFKLFSKAQQPLRELKNRIETAIANNVKIGITSQNKFVRNISEILANQFGGVIRTKEDLQEKLKFEGTVKRFALDESQALGKDLYNLLDNDFEAAKRVHSALDPELYEPAERLTREQLNDKEKKVYDLLKEINEWSHDTNFANGFIDFETYSKFKDKYIGRAYAEYEMPSEVEEFIQYGNNSFNGTTKLETGIYKARKEINDWMKENKISDPIYLTMKRYMQTIQNDAIKNYIDYNIAQNPKLISDEPKAGFTKMGDSKIWGALKGKYISTVIANDFKGFFYANEVVNTFYTAAKMYDRTKFRQFMKKYHTVYSPFVQIGNMSGNYMFAFISGIDPITFSANIPKAISEIKNRGEIYKILLKEGYLGSAGITEDMLPLIKKDTKILTATEKTQVGLKKIFGAFDEKATDLYGGADNVAKMAAYMVYLEQGLSESQAKLKVYDSFQNYGTVGKNWDFASKIPVFGNPYVKFQADLQRIIKNGITSSPLTTIGALMMLQMFGNLLSDLSGEDEEKKKIREARKGIPKIPLPFGLSVPLVWQTKYGEINVARYISPLYLYDVGYSETDLQEISRFLPIQLINIGKEELGEKTTQIAFGDPLLGTIAQVLFDRDFRGKSIQNPDATRYKNPNPTTTEKIINSFNYVARGNFPFYKSVMDFRDAMNGELDYYGRERSWKQSILNNVIKIQDFGDGQVKSSIEKEISYHTNKFVALTQRMADANKVATDNIKKAKERNITPQQLDTIIDNETKKRNERILKSAQEQEQVYKELEKSIAKYTNLYRDMDYVNENNEEIKSAQEKAKKIKDADLSKSQQTTTIEEKRKAYNESRRKLK